MAEQNSDLELSNHDENPKKKALIKRGVSKDKLPIDIFSKQKISPDGVSEDGMQKGDLLSDNISKDKSSIDGISKDKFSMQASFQDGKFIKDGITNKDGYSKDGYSKLSVREIEVLKLLCEGCTNKETAKKLNISVRTVETHRKNIMEKLNVKNLAGLIKYSIVNNLIDLE